MKNTLEIQPGRWAQRLRLGSKLRLLDFATADGSKTVNIKLQFPATESITVLWGDGTKTTRSGNGIIDVVFSKTYAGAGSYPIKLVSIPIWCD